MTRKPALLLLILLTIAVRLGAMVKLDSPLIGDYLAYYTMASGLLEGKGLVDQLGNRAYMSAGYPMLLFVAFSLFGKSLIVGQAVNVALAVLTVVLVYGCANATYRDWRVAWIGALLWAVYIDASLYTVYLAKENLMIVLLLGQLLLVTQYADSPRRPLLAALLGLLFGLQGLVGSAALAIFPVAICGIVLAPVGRFDRARDVALLSICMLLTLAPWLERNYQLFGKPLLNTNGGFNLYLGNNPSATGLFVSIADTPLGEKWHSLRKERGEAGADEEARRLAIEYIKAHPAETLALSLQKLKYFWLGDPPPKDAKKSSDFERFFRQIRDVQNLLLYGLALLGIWLSPKRSPALWLLLGSIAAYTALHAVFLVLTRYRLAIMPLVCILAGYVLFRLLQVTFPVLTRRILALGP